MTLIPTPEQEAEFGRQWAAEIILHAREERIALLERLIQKYANHVVHCAGVSCLEHHYRDSFSKDIFTDEEWTEIRKIAKEID